MAKRVIEIFTAGCYACNDVVREVKALACPNCEVVVYDLNKKCETNICEDKAKQYGVKSVPAVAINGKLADCCSKRGVNFNLLKKVGLGQL